jgi:hypothetical protein
VDRATDGNSVQFVADIAIDLDNHSQCDWGEFVHSSADGGIAPLSAHPHTVGAARRRASTALPSQAPQVPATADLAHALLLSRGSALVSEYLDDFAAVAAVKAQYSAACQQALLDARRQQLQVQAEKLAQMSRALAKVRPQVAAQRYAGAQQEY